MRNEGGMEGLGYLTLSRLNRHTCTHTCTHLGNVQWFLSRTRSLAIFLLSASFVHVRARTHTCAHKSPITTPYTCSCITRVSGMDGAAVVRTSHRRSHVELGWTKGGVVYKLDIFTSIPHNCVACLSVGGLDAEQLRMSKNETK